MITLVLTGEQAEAVAFAVARCNTSRERRALLDEVQARLATLGFEVEPPLRHLCRSCGRDCERMECWPCYDKRTLGGTVFPAAPQPPPFPAYRRRRPEEYLRTDAQCVTLGIPGGSPGSSSFPARLR